MRTVPSRMDHVWASGAYVGPDKAMARVTVQHVDMNLYKLDYNLYASLVFGNPRAAAKELPNVKSVAWSRSLDTDIATAQIVFYNTAPAPIGTTYSPSYGLDQPGFYTFDHGNTNFSERWNQTPNEWAGMLAPDNLLRTFEGYGFDVLKCPDNDPNLVQTGLWIIKDVDFSSAGLITVKCEDLGSILRDQVAFHPVIPPNFYPLRFNSEPKTSGFKQGYTFTKSVDINGGFDPAHPPPADWTGPTGPATNVTVTPQDKSFLVTWNPPAGVIADGYQIDGYEFVVDGVRIAGAVGADARSNVVRATGVANGNVYDIQVTPLYFRDSDGFVLAGNRGTPNIVSPRNGLTSVRTGSIVPDQGPDPAPGVAAVPMPGFVSFEYADVAGQPPKDIVIVVYKNGFTYTPPDPTGDRAISGRLAFPNANRSYVFHLNDLVANDPRYPVTDTVGGVPYRAVHYDTGTGVDLTGYGILVYSVDQAGNFGPGTIYQGDGTFLNPPTDGAPPHEPAPAPPQLTITTQQGTTPADPAQIPAYFNNSSNTYYIGAGGNVSNYGHTGNQVFDGNLGTYWLSIGNGTPSAGFSFEWVEAGFDAQEICQVKWQTVGGKYFVYVSVFANGTWVHHSPSDIVPYDPANPESHNGGNIPFCEVVGQNASEGFYTSVMRTPIPNATRVRLTFHNLQAFYDYPLPYRAALREMQVFSTQPALPNFVTTAYPRPQPIVDDNSPDITRTYTVYIPPKEIPGAGEQPGFYEDYTDIIKLLCAWGGFYWPQGAQVLNCDGSHTSYGFGPAPYGLINVDPVLGGQDSGRVWGDFEDTGVAGVVQLDVSVWDKKSLLEGINYVRDIIGFLFYIDEMGAVVWRSPNIFKVGNYVGNLSAGPSYVPTTVTIDEQQTLISLTASVSSRNVRERYFVASTDGRTGALTQGYNPNPIGLRRVAGWTDQHFGTQAECQIMADLIAIRALMTFRTDKIQIPGYPRIQIDDQVRIFERQTEEGYLHYVRAISSNNDLESGVYTYDLDTNWLGSQPFDTWAFNPANLSRETQNYLNATVLAGNTTFQDISNPIGSDPSTAFRPGPLSNPAGGTGTSTRGA